MAEFHLQIISPQNVVFDGNVVSLVAPGGGGYVGILADHAPILTTLKEGDITLRNGDGAEQFYHVSGGGFLEVNRNKAVMLVRQINEIPEKPKV